ncbi:hypothetical protein NXY34_08295 [Bacteroides fragilis]|nr:hypothetical protein [Bacteroides fragilis]
MDGQMGTRLPAGGFRPMDGFRLAGGMQRGIRRDFRGASISSETASGADGGYARRD